MFIVRHQVLIFIPSFPQVQKVINCWFPTLHHFMIYGTCTSETLQIEAFQFISLLNVHCALKFVSRKLNKNKIIITQVKI